MSKRRRYNEFCNLLIVLFELIGLVLLIVLPISLFDDKTYYGWQSLKFYTTLSNLSLLIVSLIMCVYFILIKCKKVQFIPTWVKYMKLYSTAATTLTMVSVFIFLPLCGTMGYGNPAGLFANSNAFYHLICPLIALINYLFYEERLTIKWYKTLCGAIPTILYSIFYLSMALTHIGPGNLIPPEYDWYRLSEIGISFGPLFAILAIGATFFFTWGLWYCNKHIHVCKNKN